MKECCEKSGGKCGCDIKRVNPTVARKDELKKYLSKYDEKDVRFFYFKSKKAPGIKITAVSVLDRQNLTLTCAFSFTSPRDSFCKMDGKLKCLKRLEEGSANQYVVTVPWLDDGLICVYLAFNRLTVRPEKLALTKFDDLVFLSSAVRVIIVK
jgi:hypothetical protein